MNRLKNAVKEHALNEDDLLQKIQANRSGAYRKENMLSFKKLLPIGLAAALIISVIASWSLFVPEVTAPVTTGTAAEKVAMSAYAMVAIDINPSFEIYTDDAGNVIKVKAKNADAEEMDVSGFINGSVEDAVVAILAWAEEKGYFATTEENQKKYAAVTTIVLDADKDGVEDDPDEVKSEDEKAKAEAANDAFGQKIQEAVQVALDTLGEADNKEQSIVRVATIKAKLRELKFAEKENVPLGLYIIHGMVDSDGTADLSEDEREMKVSDWLNSDEALNTLTKRATILERKVDKQETKETQQADVQTAKTNNGKGNSDFIPGQEKKTELTPDGLTE